MNAFPRYSPFGLPIGYPQHNPVHTESPVMTRKQARERARQERLDSAFTAQHDAPDLERWYAVLNDLVLRGVIDPQDWQELEGIRDEIYRYLR